MLGSSSSWTIAELSLIVVIACVGTLTNEGHTLVHTVDNKDGVALQTDSC